LLERKLRVDFRVETASRKLDDIDPCREDFAHLPELEGVGLDAIKRMFLLLLDLFLQVTHRHTFSDVDEERVIGHIENPTEKRELII
jgi:hypothetical protein